MPDNFTTKQSFEGCQYSRRSLRHLTAALLAATALTAAAPAMANINNVNVDDTEDGEDLTINNNVETDANYNVGHEDFGGRGWDGFARLGITGNGVLETSGVVTVGEQAGYDGMLDIRNGGTLTVNNDLRIGSVGAGRQGSLLMRNPLGSAATQTLTLNGGDLFIRSSAAVDEGGARYIVNQEIFRSDAAALVRIENGSDINVNNGGDIYVGGTGGGGDATGWSGRLEILSGASVTSTPDVDPGTMEVTDSANMYIGNSGGNGEVLVDGAGSKLSVGDVIELGKGQGSDSKGILQVRNGGEIEAGWVQVGEGDNRIVIGSDAADGVPFDPTAPGAFTVDRVSFNTFAEDVAPETQDILFNHTATEAEPYVFSSRVDGGHANDTYLVFANGVTSLTGNLSDYEGRITVGGGTLLVNSEETVNYAGTLHVAAFVEGESATLGGNGTLGGSVTIWDGGTLAPGNSIGTLTVNSDLTLYAGSTYEVELNDGGFEAGVNNDVTVVGPESIIFIEGATLHVTPENGTDDGSTYTAGQYLIIDGQPDDSVLDGTFGEITDDFVFLDFTAEYDTANSDVYLNSEKVVLFTDIAQTPNQQSLAEMLEAGGGDAEGSGEIFDALAGVAGNEDDARAAMDSLTGEAHASLGTALIHDSRFLREAVTRRIRGAFGNAGAGSLPVLAYGPDDGIEMAPAQTERFAVWGEAFGAWGDWDGDGVGTLERTTGGFYTGGDLAVAPNWRLGLLTGYSRSSFDADSVASSGDSDNVHLGLYGGGKAGQLGLRFGAAYTWHSIETSRYVALTDETLSADYDAGTAQVFAEAGYEMETAAANFEPYAGLAYVNLDTDGFTETGGAAALTVAPSSRDVTYSTLGLRAETSFLMGGTTVKARGGLGWRHAFGDISPELAMAFGGAESFAVAGVPIARDVAVIEAGLDFGLSDNATLGLSYDGQIGDDAQSHEFSTLFSVKF